MRKTLKRRRGIFTSREEGQDSCLWQTTWDLGFEEGVMAIGEFHRSMSASHAPGAGWGQR